MNTEVKEKLKQLMLEKFNLYEKYPEGIDDDESLLGDGIGLDSIDILVFARILENEFSIKIPINTDNLARFNTINNGANYIMGLIENS